MNDEIEFGQLEEARPQTQRRPDQNRQYAVRAIGTPAQHDLPIFVDLDVMLDMERHAQWDTTVELGGIMLGGQHEDYDGQPFVVVCESLRAEYYESTRGSFKFTHETWSEFTRQRETFPPELRIVGWYHTHPDWGVFLSGMDMYICDNFFNGRLDVALVIDPCRDERGMFQRTDRPGPKRVHQTSGFYLYTSRFREAELEQFIAELEGQSIMSRDPRHPTSYAPAPAVHFHGDRGQWQTVAVFGLLIMQLAIVMVLMLRMSASTATSENAQLTTVIDRLDALTAKQAEYAQTERQLWETEMRLKLTQEMLARQDQNQPLPQLIEQAAEIESLQQSQVAALAYGKQVQRELMAKTLEAKNLEAMVSRLEGSLKQERQELKESAAQLSEAQKELKNWKSDNARAAALLLMRDWRFVTAAVVVMILVSIASVYGTVVLIRRTTVEPRAGREAVAGERFGEAHFSTERGSSERVADDHLADDRA